MDPYAAQWAQYGYAVSAPDPNAAAAYNYYNYAGVQAQTNPAAAVTAQAGAELLMELSMELLMELLNPNDHLGINLLFNLIRYVIFVLPDTTKLRYYFLVPLFCMCVY